MVLGDPVEEMTTAWESGGEDDDSALGHEGGQVAEKTERMLL